MHLMAKGRENPSIHSHVAYTSLPLHQDSADSAGSRPPDTQIPLEPLSDVIANKECARETEYAARRYHVSGPADSSPSPPLPALLEEDGRSGEEDSGSRGGVPDAFVGGDRCRPKHGPCALCSVRGGSVMLFTNSTLPALEGLAYQECIHMYLGRYVGKQPHGLVPR